MKVIYVYVSASLIVFLTPGGVPEMSECKLIRRHTNLHYVRHVLPFNGLFNHFLQMPRGLWKPGIRIKGAFSQTHRGNISKFRSQMLHRDMHTTDSPEYS